MKSICKIPIGLCLFCMVLNIKGQSLVKQTENSEEIVTVEFNKNVEFLGYTIYIGEPGEPSEGGSSHPLRRSLNEKKRQFQGDESLTTAFSLGSALPYSFFVELFTLMDELPHQGTVKIPEGVMQRYDLNTPADRLLVRNILEQVNIFYQRSGFDQFWESSQTWYVQALEEVNKIKPGDELIGVMENFYEQDFRQYKIIPSLTFWSGPGFGFSEAGGESGATAFFVLGPLSNEFRFDNEERLRTLAIHEFGHSFVNHLLETRCSELIRETEHLFDPIIDTMSPQGYPEWSYCVNEHFVRAGEVLIPELMNNKDISRSNFNYNVEERGFIYLPFIVEHLRTYRIVKGLSYKQSIKETMKDFKKEFVRN